jgi:hypothetical protein
MIEKLNRKKENHNSHLSIGRFLTTKGFCIASFSFVSKWFQPYSIDSESIGSFREEGNGTSIGGIYLTINTDIAAMVNARRVPTLTC